MVHPFKMKGFFIAPKNPKNLKPNTDKLLTPTGLNWCTY